MNPSRLTILAEMGLSPVWVRRDAPPVAPGSGKTAKTGLPASAVAAPEDHPAVAPAPAEMPGSARPSGIAGMGWEELRQAILACRACGLCARRRQAVPGVGDENAAWLFIGEGPGAEEDARGEPFVGQAGRLLDAMLAAIGLKRGEDVYIANAVKCRPPGNRTPENAEMAACLPYLERQIALLRPRLIVLLGRAAVNAVLGEERSLASMRGRTLAYHCGDREIPVLATYHPAYLLRNLPDKAKAWEDLCRARALMRGPGQR
ncbi:MAG: uracil-DNA glycosylase [Candidatus Accumulibacter sp.]|jgi:DNA polymerase|nr:uracil-DNA glycosylase [Accumulibacter sp.]